MSLPTSPQTNHITGRQSWQDQLSEHCTKSGIAPPVFNIVSDRRGGRTAWSSTVTVQGRNFDARYWYDGQYINNAKEDAAEVALKQLCPKPGAQTDYQGQLYSHQPQQQQGTGYGRGVGGF